MPRFSANLGFMWPDRPLPGRIEAAAAAGFKAVELHWPYDIPARQVRAACMAGGVELLAINTPPGDTARGEFGLAAVPGKQADFRDSLKMSLDYAADAGAGAVHVMAGVVAPADIEHARHVLIENLQQACEIGRNFTLLLEAINHRDKPDYFYSRIGEAARIAEDVGAANLRLMFDVYHAAVAEGDVLTKLQGHADMIAHVQVAGVPLRTEPDEGEINYRAIFDHLDANAYAGWIGCEYKPRGDTDEGLDWMRKLGVAPGGSGAD